MLTLKIEQERQLRQQAEQQLEQERQKREALLEQLRQRGIQIDDL